MPRTKKKQENRLTSNPFALEVERFLNDRLEYEVDRSTVSVKIWVERSLFNGVYHMGSVKRNDFETLEEAKLKALEYALASLLQSLNGLPGFDYPFSMCMRYSRVS